MSLLVSSRTFAATVACSAFAAVLALSCNGAFAEQPAAAPATQPTVALSEAAMDLERLEAALKNKKSINDEINQYLDLVAGHFARIAPPEAPAALAADADEETKATHAAAVAEHDKAVQKFDRDLAAYRDRVVKAIFRAFKTTDVKKETNLRDEVNRKAAQSLGALTAAWPGEDGLKQREDVSRDLRKSIDELHKAKWNLSTDVLGEAFGAVGSLNTPQGLAWMMKEYTHAKNNEVIWLVAAHKAMVKFTEVEGSVRYELVELFVRTYAGVESAAEKSSSDPKDQSKKRFWDDIKTATIPVVQYFSGNPTNEENVALATMREFEDWFRDHKNPRKAPWTDADE